MSETNGTATLTPAKKDAAPVVIEDRYDRKRGCGWRKPGGIYLVGSGEGFPCGRLPIELTVCPCCGEGIRPMRTGLTYVDGDKLKQQKPCESGAEGCPHCPLSDAFTLGKTGLVWVGGAYYPTPESFIAEAKEQGISRRLPGFPKNFKVGETWVFLAHRKAVPATGDAPEKPGVFYVFKPTAIEYVVKGDEDPEKLERRQRQGCTLVRVHRMTDGEPPAQPEPAPEADADAESPFANIDADQYEGVDFEEAPDPEVDPEAETYAEPFRTED
jgi:hypothetical protein